MAARTNSEKIEAAEREILEQKHLLQHFQDRYALEVGLLRSEVSGLANKSHELALKVAVVEQRLAQVEKLLRKAAPAAGRSGWRSSARA